MMMKSVAALLLLLGGSNHLICFGFTLFNPSNPSFLSTRIRSSSSLSAGSYGDKDRDAIMARNNARTCVKSFLTQRAIQSFMFLLEECRDPHSGKWIQEFLGLQNLLEYHGTGAFDIDRFPQWEAVLLDMMEKPKGAYYFFFFLTDRKTLFLPRRKQMLLLFSRKRLYIAIINNTLAQIQLLCLPNDGAVGMVAGAKITHTWKNGG
jgi:hypothetical protein